MTKTLTVITAILVALSPMVAAAASSDYFYSSVTPSAEDRASEKPLAVLPDCAAPPASNDPSVLDFLREALTVAYEVNGVSFCGGGSVSSTIGWIMSVPSGTKVKIRYATRNTTASLYQCGSNDSLFLFLYAPAMGINGSYLNSQGQWQTVLTFFRTAPPTGVWNDIYDDTPLKGDYELYMGCDTQFRWGWIGFQVQ